MGAGSPSSPPGTTPPPSPPAPNLPASRDFSNMQAAFGGDVANLFKTVYEKLEAKKATKACKSLLKLDLNDLTLEKLHFFEPERVLEDVEEHITKGARRVALWRNLVALLPLILTWFSLAFAAIFYEQEISADTKHQLVLQPFLSLWQRGFGNPNSLFTFSNVAFLDFGFIVLIIILTYGVHQSEQSALKDAREMSQLLDEALGDLAVKIERKKVTLFSAEDWATAAKKVVEDAMKQIGAQATAGEKVILAAQKAIQDASIKQSKLLTQFEIDVTSKLRDFGTELTRALSSVQADNKQFIKDSGEEARQLLVSAIDANKNVLTTELTPVIGQLKTVVDDLNKEVGAYQKASTTMGEKATDLSTAASDLSKSVGTYVSTVSSIDAALTRLEKTESDLAGKVTSAVSDMAKAAAAVDGVGSILRGAIVSDFTKMATNIEDASKSLAAANGQLSRTSTELGRTGYYLDQVGGRLYQTMQWFDWIARQLAGIVSRIPAGAGTGPVKKPRTLKDRLLNPLGRP